MQVGRGSTIKRLALLQTDVAQAMLGRKYSLLVAPILQ